MSIEKRLDEIREGIENAKLKRAKLEQEYETAETNRALLLTRLVSEFGVYSLDEAKELLTDMGAEFKKLFQLIEEKLESVKNDS